MVCFVVGFGADNEKLNVHECSIDLNKFDSTEEQTNPFSFFISQKLLDERRKWREKREIKPQTLTNSIQLFIYKTLYTNVHESSIYLNEYEKRNESRFLTSKNGDLWT